MFKRLSIVSLLLLQGCAPISWQLDILNYGSQATSYATTGKGIGDNFMSYLFDMDCELWNIVTVGSYCLEILELQDYLE